MEVTGFGASDKSLLVQIVKDCQKSKVQGTQGSWKDYLKAQTPTLGKVDPSMHSWKAQSPCHCAAKPADFGEALHCLTTYPTFQTLAGFLATLSKPQAGMLIGPHRDWDLHQKQVNTFLYWHNDPITGTDT